MSRLENAFKNPRVLIPYLMAFDPDRETTLKLMHELVAAGAGVIELGMVFSDPMADGPTIQAAAIRARKSGSTLAGVLGLVSEFRATNTDTPIVLMGYYNPIYRFGVETFCVQAAKAGVDGLIVVDVPPEEAEEIQPIARAHGLDWIRLIAPTSIDARLPLLLREASGFVYYISITGVTGAASASLETVARDVAAIKKHTPLPVAIGFGIKTPEQAKALGTLGDAVVVGSALVEHIHQGHDAGSFILKLVTALK